MGDIVSTGIPADYAVPGNFIQLNLGAGPVSGSALDYPILLIGNKTTAGSATTNTVVYGPTTAVQMQTEDDVIALFGTGSELHRGYLRIVDSRKGAGNQTTAIYAIAVTESVGTAASQVLTFAVTATGSGSAVVYVGAESVSAPIASGDTAIVVATAVVAAVNARTDWPVTAANGGGSLAVVTLTAKVKGLRGNWLRGFGKIVPGTVGGAVGTTVDVVAPAFYTSGATADDNTTALATILPMRFFTIVSAAEDATQFGALATQVAAQALPITGIRQWCIAGYNGTQANAITVSTGRNNAYAEMIHLQNSDWTPFEMACHAAGVYASYEIKPKARHNFCGFGNESSEAAVWKVPAPLSGSSPTQTAINTAIKNGLTPIGVNPNGTTYIAMRCTTKCLNGSNPDFRSRESHKRTVSIFFADDWYAKQAANFAGKDISDDPAQGAHVPGDSVVTPKTIKGSVIQLVRDYESNDQLKNVETIIANIVVTRASSPTTRAGVLVPLQVIDILAQTNTNILQVG